MEKCFMFEFLVRSPKNRCLHLWFLCTSKRSHSCIRSNSSNSRGYQISLVLQNCRILLRFLFEHPMMAPRKRTLIRYITR